MRRIICTLVLVMGFAASASALELGVRGSYWFPEFDAQARVDDGNIIGTTMDVVDLLGIEDENFPALEVYAGLGSHHIALSAVEMNFEGDAALTQSITFNGETYSTGQGLHRAGYHHGGFLLPVRSAGCGKHRRRVLAGAVAPGEVSGYSDER